LKLFNDAAAGPNGGGAFADISAAIQQAQHFIFIAGWSFHPLVRLTPHEWDGGKCVGELLIDKAASSEDLLIAIHTWDHTVGIPDPQNDSGGKYLNKLLERAGRKEGVKNLQWRKSSRSGRLDYLADLLGWSHHQKFIVLDTAGFERKGRRMVTVFFGGLDLSKGRLDWPAHPNLPEDPTVKHLQEELGIDGEIFDDWYNNEFEDSEYRRKLPRQAWHDVHAQLTGPAAWDFIREFVGRWAPDPGGFPVNSATKVNEPWKVAETFKKLCAMDKYLVQQWEIEPYLARFDPGFARVSAQVVRSMTKDHWHSAGTNLETNAPREYSGKRRELVWSLGANFEASIQKAYLNHIRQAERFIYIETQYFIGSGGQWGRSTVENKVPETIVQRIKERKKDGKDFHVYVVLPLFPEGDPTPLTKVSQSQRNFQWRTIEYMIRALYEEKGIGQYWPNYLSFYFLAQWDDKSTRSWQADRAARVKAARRYMIYVHSKLMICDDRLMILGSANLNERGLAGGRDAEICVAISEADDSKRIQELRRALWGEHLVKPKQTIEAALEKWWEHPETPSCIERIQKLARGNYLNFRQAKARDQSGHLCLWPLSYFSSARRCVRGPLADLPEDFDHELIPDHPDDELLRLGTTLAKVQKSSWSLAPSIVGFTTFAELAE
jgi:phospholipase D1/2